MRTRCLAIAAMRWRELALVAVWILIFAYWNFTVTRRREVGSRREGELRGLADGAWRPRLFSSYRALADGGGCRPALTIGLVLIARMLVRCGMRFFYARPQFTVPLVIVGLNPVGLYLRDQVIGRNSHIRIGGFR